MAPFFVNKFLSYLQTEKRYSAHTNLAYQMDIEQFLDFTIIVNEKELAEVTPMVIRGWIVDLMDKEYTKRTVNRKLSSLRSFFKWLAREAVIPHNPMQKVQGPKTEKRLPSFARSSDLTVEKLEHVFSSSFEGVRDRLIVEVFYQTGIRLSELINLKNSDIEKDRIKVLGKRNKERIIPISSLLFEMIEEYRKQLKLNDLENEFLFLLNNGNKVYAKFVYRIINSYLGQVTNLDKCSPHVLRHTFATHMLNNGAGLETLKDLLGHANLSATQVYTHNSFKQLTNIYSQAHPRGHKKK
jgi:integrase/recombinase XerC